ncbi:NADP-dependent aldehyde dehydrogenase [Streptomyces sp. V4I23]|uniref:aldehyde dehydrogenase (NADP(+)) n=1 Tax=Streptomyces sp. V4I23 TaxID=3042282 RepID=UPI00277E5189|nr:aldehyde dehydrogenase (NADP(+)) [Streptomyces sp. V4I23]MDQ1008765.1 NADP-dependent aldehyde dehydrogenase [Streptomyces sp. V4I23]
MTTITTCPDTTAPGVDAAARDAAGVAHALAALGPDARAGMLRTVADALDDASEELVGLAHEETGLTTDRLSSELLRTTGQLRMFADTVLEGSHLDAVIDTAVVPPPGSGGPPRPDLRRMMVPLGPVLVFAASNFPFAFSVAGGDTASALAAGCPVVVKAHPGHPRLSARTAHHVTAALGTAGAPHGTFALIAGLDAGRRALQDPHIKAAAFTGSTRAGRALSDLASARPEPIPFYGELGSINPVFVTERAVAARGERLVEEYVASFTQGAGQFCTKPGLLLLPAGHGLDQQLADAVARVVPARMVSESVHAGYTTGLRRLSEVPGVRTLHGGAPAPEPAAAPALLSVPLAVLRAHAAELLTECFGPMSFVVEYEDEADLAPFAAELPGQLTAALHAENGEAGRLAALAGVLVERAGRLVWNGWPTGVAVTWSMHHGGPWPATTAPLHTSVGATAVRRFMRPVCHQSAPQEALPPALRDRNVLGIPRRVNGRLGTGDVGT